LLDVAMDLVQESRQTLHLVDHHGGAWRHGGEIDREAPDVGQV
jgi:hypothetical protein